MKYTSIARGAAAALAASAIAMTAMTVAAPAAHADGVPERCLSSVIKVTKIDAATKAPLAGATVRVSYTGSEPTIGLTKTDQQAGFIAAAEAVYVADNSVPGVGWAKANQTAWASAPAAKSVKVTTGADGTATVYAYGGQSVDMTGMNTYSFRCDAIKVSAVEVTAPTGYDLNSTPVSASGSLANNDMDDPATRVTDYVQDHTSLTIADTKTVVTPTPAPTPAPTVAPVKVIPKTTTTVKPAVKVTTAKVARPVVQTG